jgi:outer membrane protein assembly factor BamB
MNNVRFSVRWGGKTLPLALFAMTASAMAASVPAGTVLTTRAEAIYTDGGPRIVQSAPMSVTVEKAAVATVTLDQAPAVVRGTQPYRCTITNAGNYAGGIVVYVTKSSNTDATLVYDTNEDGVWQRSETTTVLSQPPMPPDDPLKCFLLLKAKAGTLAGDQGGAVVFVSPKDDPLREASAEVDVTFADRALAPAFTFQASEPLNSSPTIRDGVALVGSEGGTVYAVQTQGAAAGSLLWRYPVSGGVGAPIRGRVAVDASGYYFTANNGKAYHLDRNGGLVWETQAADAGASMEAMPLVDATSVLLACGDGHIRVLDKQTGAVLGTSAALGTGALTTPAAPRPGELWVGASDGNLYNVNVAQGFTVLSARKLGDAPLLATPFVDVRSGLVMSVTPDGNVYAMRLHSDQTLWGPVSLGCAVQGSPWVDSAAGIAYFAATDGTLHALRVMDGAPMTRYPAQITDAGGFQGSPVVDPLPGGASVAFVGSDAGKLYAVTAQDPTQRIAFDAKDAGVRFLGSPALSGAKLDDLVVVSGSNGALYGFVAGDALN